MKKCYGPFGPVKCWLVISGASEPPTTQVCYHLYPMVPCAQLRGGGPGGGGALSFLCKLTQQFTPVDY